MGQLMNGRRCVLHRPVDREGDGYVYSLKVELEDDGLTAHGWSCLNGQGGPDLPAFLAHLSELWRGWPGTLTWASMENEMTLDELLFRSLKFEVVPKGVLSRQFENRDVSMELVTTSKTKSTLPAGSHWRQKHLALVDN